MDSRIKALLDEELSRVEARGESIVNHVRMTISIVVISAAFLLLLLAGYIISAAALYSSSQGAWRFGAADGVFSLIRVGVVIATILVIVMNITATARIWLYKTVLSVLESISLAAAQNFLLFIPDAIDEKLEKKLLELAETRPLKGLASDLMVAYQNGLAWMYLTVLVVITLPMGSVSNISGILLSIIAVAFLIYAIYGWERPPFWMHIIQQFALYFASGLIIWNLFVIPLINPAQYFGGWGLASEEPVGAIVKLFWAIVFVTILALIGLGFGFQKDNTGRWEVVVKNGILLFLAGVVILALFLFGGMAVESLSALAQTPATELAKPKSSVIINLAILAFLVIIGLFIWRHIAASNKSSSSTALKVSSGSSGNTWKTVVITTFVVIAIFWFFLPLLAGLTSGVSFTNVSAQSSRKAELGNPANGPYLANPSNSLEQGKAYKFADKETVWIYEGKSLRPVASPSAFAKYYNCTGGGRPLDCADIYLMPSTIQPGDKIFGGGMIK